MASRQGYQSGIWLSMRCPQLVANGSFDTKINLIDYSWLPSGKWEVAA